MARDADEETRADLAARTDLKPEILYFLAEDPSPKVRARIAANEKTPYQADLLLATDKNQGVRETLAEKLVRVAPGLGADERDKLRKAAYDALSTLARDQAIRVRQTLAEALKEVVDAPPDVIRRLAWDVEAAVATPVLRFSPVLTDDDLIEIIHKRPNPQSISAISQREAVSATVSDAIIHSDDEAGIAFLLKNESAQIREETLDRLLDRAIDVSAWHMPLAMRPKLPSAAAVKIARFVAEDILKRMVARKDLDPGALQAVRAVVHKRLADPEAIHVDGEAGPRSADTGVNVDDDNVFDWASKLWEKGELNEEAFIEYLERDRKKAIAILAVMADLPYRVVERVVDLKSAKGCIAVAWRARLSPATGELIQSRLAEIPSRGMMHAVGGQYPLDDDEMKWQIDFVLRL